MVRSCCSCVVGLKIVVWLVNFLIFMAGIRDLLFKLNHGFKLHGFFGNKYHVTKSLNVRYSLTHWSPVQALNFRDAGVFPKFGNPNGLAGTVRQIGL